MRRCLLIQLDRSILSTQTHARALPYQHSRKASHLGPDIYINLGTTRTPVPLPAGTRSMCVAASGFHTIACTCSTLSTQTHARALPYQLRRTATHLDPDMSRYNMHASATASWHALNVCRCLKTPGIVSNRHYVAAVCLYIILYICRDVCCGLLWTRPEQL